MSDPLPIETWRRRNFEPGGAPNVFQLFCFAKAPLADVPLSALRFGLPTNGPHGGDLSKLGIDVRDVPRGADPAWFDGFRSGALRTLAERALGPQLKLLDEADTLHAVLVRRDDAQDLAHLQAAWALAKWLVERGVTVVLDAQCNRFWKASELADWPVRRPLTLSGEVNVIVEADPGATVGIVHTRGLQKFGRPDLVALDVEQARWDGVAGLLHLLAAQLADGKTLRAGEALTIATGKDGVVEQVQLADFGPDVLHLNNAALRVSAVQGA
ncbi:MAG: hypothetical protein U0228_23495 [Myxococcaceae bacterium]